MCSHWFEDRTPSYPKWRIAVRGVCGLFAVCRETHKEYGEAFGANFAGWFFLTGSPPTIREVTRRYGVFAAKAENGNVDHTFLTSIIDRHGILRVQYLGVRFDPEEFRLDLLSLVKE